MHKNVPDLVIRALNCARFCVVCALNGAQILVVRTLDYAEPQRDYEKHDSNTPGQLLSNISGQLLSGIPGIPTIYKNIRSTISTYIMYIVYYYVNQVK